MHKPRLRRLDWVFSKSPVYFLTACAANRRPLFANDSVHQAFIRYSQEAGNRGVWVGRYVLMPDHVHLFAGFSGHSSGLSAWMKALKGAVSEGLRDHGLIGPFWQKGFFDHVMRSEESYAKKWQYVRDNPVRAGLVLRWQDWPYQGEIHHVEL